MLIRTYAAYAVSMENLLLLQQCHIQEKRQQARRGASYIFQTI